MSDKKQNDTAFTNEDTIVRRQWIESALESVRGQLDSGCPDPDAAISDTSVDGEPAQDTAETDSGPAAEAAGNPRMDATRPRLYVAWSAPERRSGT